MIQAAVAEERAKLEKELEVKRVTETALAIEEERIRLRKEAEINANQEESKGDMMFQKMSSEENFSHLEKI